jgi:hypothetical protein
MLLLPNKYHNIYEWNGMFLNGIKISQHQIETQAFLFINEQNYLFKWATEQVQINASNFD